MVGGCAEGKQIAVHMDRLSVMTGHLLGQSSRNGPAVCLSLTTFSQCLSDPHNIPILSSLSTASSSYGVVHSRVLDRQL